MAIGKRVAKWLGEIVGPPSSRRKKAAEHLLDTSEYYFDGNKVSAQERQQVLDGFASLVEDPDSLVRRAIAQITGLMKYWSNQTEEILSKLLQDPDSGVQTHAVWACGHIGAPASPLLPHLTRLAEHPDREVRWRVPWALAEIASPQSSASQCAVLLLKDDDPTVRMYALAAVGACVREPSADLLDTVAEYLQDHAPEVSAAACRTLVALEDTRDSTVSALRTIVATRATRVSLDAVYALTKLDSHALDFAPARHWLETNRGYWWVDDLLGDDEKT